MRILLTSILLAIGFSLSSQIIGEYTGKSIYSTVTEKNGNTYDLFNKKKIILKSDSSFLFWRTYRTENAACWGCVDTIFVSGKWRISKDTIILNSRYQVEDFVEINDFRTDDSLDYFIYNTSYNCHNSDLVIVNDTISFDIHCWSVIKKDISEVSSVRFKNYIDNTFLYEYSFYPREYKPNFFTINIKNFKKDKYNDSVMNNIKLLIENGKLIPIIQKGLIKVENGYDKKQIANKH